MARKKSKKNKKTENLEETQDVILADSETEAQVEETSLEVESNENSEELSEELLQMSSVNSEDEAEVEEESEEEANPESEADLEGTELAEFDSAEIEDVEHIEEERLDSIVESLLFASDKPITLATIKASFKGTNIRTEHIRKSIQRLALELQGGRRGVTLEEVTSGFQIRTKVDNMKFLTRSVKPKAFRLSGPALEVLAILAYKQPTVKSEIDDIRGVESGHLLRALMEKGLVSFEGKSELPGKPMAYGTSRKFLEIFGLRNLKELPTLSQIDELLPEGIGDENDEQKERLGDLTDKLSQTVATSYSEGEDELLKISEQLHDITTTTDFFENEKANEKRAKEEEKARNIREALMDVEKAPTVSNRDKKWLERFDAAVAENAEPLVKMESPEGSEETVGGEELSQDETAEARFSEEEDISLDQDLNVDLHDSDESV